MTAATKGKAIRLLYMEDDAGLARLVKRKLERDGYAVDVAPDGGKGLAMLEEAAYDFLLLDQKMPVHSGLEVIRILSFRDRLPPTVMVTGAGDERTAAKAIKLGAADYVVKDVEGGYLELLPLVIEQVRAGRRLAEEKKCAEEALLRSEEAYRSLAENLPVGVFRTTADGEGRVVSGNPALAAMFGYERPEELADVRVVDLYADGDDRARFVEKMNRQRAVKAFEALFRRRDGSEFWGSLSARAFRDDGGAVAYFDGVLEDITARKRAEEGLRESEERYRVLFNGGDDAVFVHCLEDDGGLGPFIEVNDVACRRLGLTREELLGLSPAEVTAPAKVKSRTALAEKLRKDNYAIFESALIPKEGEAVPVEINAHLFDYCGRPTVMSVARDITERKRAEEALRRERDRARSYLDVVGVIILALDAEGKITLINRKGCDLLGREEKKLVGRNWFDVCLPPRLEKDVRAVFAKLMAGEVEAAEYFENAVLPASGEEKIIAWHNTVLRDRLGRIIGTLSSGEDITERKRAEQALRESEERYRTTIDGTTDFIHVVDRDMRLVLFNVAFVKAVMKLGINPKLGDKLFDVCPFCRPETREEYTRVFETGGPVVTEGYNEIEGNVIWTEGRKIPVFDAEGRVYRVITIIRDITERKRAAAALRESEEKFRQIGAAANDAIIMMDREARISYWNEAATSIFGYAAEEILGKRLHDVLVAENYRSQCEEGLRTFREAGKGPVVDETLEVTALRKDGVEFPVELSISALKVKGEWNALGILRDITERKRAEEALRRGRDELEERVRERTAELAGTLKKLRESEEKYRGVVEQLQDGVVIIQDGVLAFFNAKFAQTVEYPPEELRRRPFSDFLAPHVRESVLARYKRRLAGEEVPPVYESVGLARDGREIPVEFNVTLIQYNGRPAELVIIRDLTERRRQEKVLHKQEWILKNVFNNMPDSVYVVDPASREVLFVNKAAEDAFGAGLVEAKCYRAIWGLDGPCRGCNLEEMFAADDGATYSRESFNEKVGRWLAVNSKAVPWFDERAVRCSVLTDISERKALEEEIVAHNKALHNTVRERTAALEAKNRELESFAYSISHDLRAPLRSIEGFSRALLEDHAGDLDEDGRDFLTRVVNGATRMDRLINDLLEYSRLGRRGVTFEPVDMNELVATSLEDLRASLKAAGGHVAVAESLPTVSGDPSLLLVLWHNLLGNAIKYRRADVPLEVEIACREDDGKYVFSVKDNGIGLDMKYQKKVFDIFQRLHGGDEYAGTGIGLASARKVVAAHRGRIWYESEPGRGATFFFELGPPLVAAEAEGKG